MNRGPAKALCQACEGCRNRSLRRRPGKTAPASPSRNLRSTPSLYSGRNRNSVSLLGTPPFVSSSRNLRMSAAGRTLSSPCTIGPDPGSFRPQILIRSISTPSSKTFRRSRTFASPRFPSDPVAAADGDYGYPDRDRGEDCNARRIEGKPRDKSLTGLSTGPGVAWGGSERFARVRFRQPDPPSARVHNPTRNGDAVRHPAARGRVAARHRGGGQPRHLRDEVPRRRQGPLALVAEIIAGELARRLGLRVPELVLADLDPRIPGSEPDPEIQDLLRASEGLNLGVDFLPSSFGFDPLGWTADRDFASQVLWFDALVHNVDRTWRNPNLLVWHRDIWLIDHGAALYFHHNWPKADPKRPFDASEHVLRDRATALAAAHDVLAPRVTASLLREVTALVPPGWFGDRGAEAYVEHLLLRTPIVPEVIRL